MSLTSISCLPVGQPNATNVNSTFPFILDNYILPFPELAKRAQNSTDSIIRVEGLSEIQSISQPIHDLSDAYNRGLASLDSIKTALSNIFKVLEDPKCNTGNQTEIQDVITKVFGTDDSIIRHRGLVMAIVTRNKISSSLNHQDMIRKDYENALKGTKEATENAASFASLFPSMYNATAIEEEFKQRYSLFFNRTLSPGASTTTTSSPSASNLITTTVISYVTVTPSCTGTSNSNSATSTKSSSSTTATSSTSSTTATSSTPAAASSNSLSATASSSQSASSSSTVSSSTRASSHSSSSKPTSSTSSKPSTTSASSTSTALRTLYMMP